MALSGYRLMWMMVLFDLPVLTKKERKAATKFRKFLLDQGFEMSQFSVYMRFCAGKEQAEVIRAAADRERTILEANAYRDAEKLRGEGDAGAASIYAQAYGKDPEFYAFVRSLNAYRDSFSARSDLLVLDPNSDFFKYLNNPRGR